MGKAKVKKELGENGKATLTLGQLPASLACGNGASSSKTGLKTSPKVSIPKAKIGSSELERAKELLCATKSQAASIKEWMNKIGLPQRAEIDQNVLEDEDYLDVTILVVDTIDGEEVTIEMSIRDLRQNFEDSINRYLNWGDQEDTDTVSRKGIRRAAHSALITFSLSQVKNLPELYALTKEFFQKGYIEEVSDNLLNSPNGKRCTFKGPEGRICTLAVDERYGDLGKDAVLAEEVAGIINDLDARFKIVYTQDAKDMERRLRETSDTKLDDLCQGKVVGNGLCALKVLPNENSRDEGTVQVRLDENGRIWPVAASGKLQESIEQFKGAKVFVTLEGLFDEDGRLYDKPYFNPSKSMDKEEFKRWVNVRVKFWWWVRNGLFLGFKWQEKQAKRAMAQEEKNALLQQMRNDLGTENTISPENWMFECQPGNTVLIKEDWENNDDPIIEFLPVKVRREVIGEQSFISFVSTLPCAGDLFTKCLGKYEEKDRFEGIDDPLKRFLRAMWGQMKKSARN